MTEIATISADSVFSLPEEMKESKRWSDLYEFMTQKLMQEAAGIPMTTVQTLLVERIATLYVTIRHREEHGTFLPKEMKEYSDLWLSLAKQFSQLVKDNSENKSIEERQNFLHLIFSTIQDVPDADTRQLMREKIVAGITAIENGTYDATE